MATESALQVSQVPTEDEMNNVTGMFRRALDAIVLASQLAKDVDALRNQVQGLTESVERYRDQVANMDAALTAVRRERDELQARVSEQNTQISNLNASLANVEADRDAKQRDIDAKASWITQVEADNTTAHARIRGLEVEVANKTAEADHTSRNLQSTLDKLEATQGTLDTAIADRDEARGDAAKLREELAEANRKLKSLQDTFHNVFGMVMHDDTKVSSAPEVAQPVPTETGTGEATTQEGSGFSQPYEADGSNAIAQDVADQRERDELQSKYGW